MHQKKPVKALNEIEVQIMASSGSTLWRNMASLAAASRHYEDPGNPQTSPRGIAYLCMQAILDAAVDNAGLYASDAMISAAGRLLGQIEAQLPEEIHAAAEALFRDAQRIGMLDYLTARGQQLAAKLEAER